MTTALDIAKRLLSQREHSAYMLFEKLKQRGLEVHAMLAGGAFQKDYAEQLRQFCNNHDLNSQIDFLPQLNRTQLARFFQLQHVCIKTAKNTETARQSWA